VDRVDVDLVAIDRAPTIEPETPTLECVEEAGATRPAFRPRDPVVLLL
jgi:hypothetical protein